MYKTQRSKEFFQFHSDKCLAQQKHFEVLRLKKDLNLCNIGSWNWVILDDVKNGIDIVIIVNISMSELFLKWISKREVC